MNQNLYTFAKKQGFNWPTFYEAIKELEAKGWVVMVKDLSINKVTLIIKDPVIIANNLIKTLDIMYNKSFVESYKYVERLNNDYKEVLKDYEQPKT